MLLKNWKRITRATGVAGAPNLAYEKGFIGLKAEVD